MPANVGTPGLTPVSPSLLWATRITSLLGPVIVWVFAIVMAPAVAKAVNILACGPPNRSAMDNLRIAGILLAMVAPVPAYLEILWRLTGLDRKRGLSLAVATGWLAFVVSGGFLAFLAYCLSLQPHGEDWGALGLYLLLEKMLAILGFKLVQGLPGQLLFKLLALFVLSQLLLMVIASATRRALGRDGGSAGAWVSRAKAIGYLALFLVLLNQGMKLLYRPVPRDAKVVKMLQLIHGIHRAEAHYAAIYEHGYSVTLATLGPPPSGIPASASAAGLISEDLANGKAEGYSFQYRGPMHPDNPYESQGYEINATPAADCQGACYCSFISNQTGWIWGTSNPANPFAARLEEPPEHAPPPEANPARILVETSPNAEVYLDDVPKGQANPDGRLEIGGTPSGYHVLLVTLPFKNPYKQAIQVQAGKDLTVEATLTDVSPPPAAAPAVAGRPAAKAPTAGAIRPNPMDGINHVWIPPGTFLMGCLQKDRTDYTQMCDGSEQPQHQVTITKGFWMDQTPVTVAAYKRFAAATGQQLPPPPRMLAPWQDTMPLVGVNWTDAQAYCQWAGGRLPTEAEYEYAARAGSTENLYGPLRDIAWFMDNSGKQIHNVAEKRPNAWGLYDMMGNVWEWASDWYDGYYYRNSPSQDPEGPSMEQASTDTIKYSGYSTGNQRAQRGGSWIESSLRIRFAARRGLQPERSDQDIGFRCAADAQTR